MSQPQGDPSRPTLDYRRDMPAGPSRIIQGIALCIVYVVGLASWAAWVGFFLFLFFRFFSSGRRGG